MWVISARFNVCGHQCREIDITPALAVAFIILFVWLSSNTGA
jgi:hypothetical protein